MIGSPNPFMRNWVIVLSVAQVIFMIWLPDSGFDKYYWETWAKEIMTNGLGSVYLDHEVNNHPLNLYLLKVLSWFFSDPQAVNPTSINWLKALVMPFNLLSILVMAYLMRINGVAQKEIGWLILNPAFWYNTVVWGQVDVVYTFFALIALILAERGRWKSAFVFMLIAVNFKLQAIVIVPLVVLLSYQSVKKELWPQKTLGLGLVLVTQTLILIPFIISGNIHSVFDAVTSRSVNHFPVISKKAYNVWHYFFTDPRNTPDTVRILYIPMRLWGLVLFGLASSMNMSLLALSVFNRAFDNLSRWQRIISIFQVATLIYLAFFLFNTQMHERYIHPALLFGFLPFVLSQDRTVYILVSIGYLLNMEAVMQMLDVFFYIDHATVWVFNPMLITSIFLLAYIWGTVSHARQFLALKNPNSLQVAHT